MTRRDHCKGCGDLIANEEPLCTKCDGSYCMECLLLQLNYVDIQSFLRILFAEMEVRTEKNLQPYLSIFLDKSNEMIKLCQKKNLLHLNTLINDVCETPTSKYFTMKFIEYDFHMDDSYIDECLPFICSDCHKIKLLEERIKILEDKISNKI